MSRAKGRIATLVYLGGKRDTAGGGLELSSPLTGRDLPLVMLFYAEPVPHARRISRI
jgi:hypothetical protein